MGEGKRAGIGAGGAGGGGEGQAAPRHRCHSDAPRWSAGRGMARNLLVFPWRLKRQPRQHPAIKGGTASV